MKNQNHKTAKRGARSVHPIVSRAGLIQTCRMAYQYVLDQSAHPMLKEPKRLNEAQQRELGRRLAETWHETNSIARIVKESETRQCVSSGKETSENRK